MIRLVTLFVMGLALFAQLALGQVNTGTISGIVRDETGAVIPGVSVTLRNVETGATRTVQTDAQGRYHAPSLPLGDYEVRAEIAGFQREVRSGIRLTVGREAQVDLTLRVGEVTQTVEVMGEAPLVDTATSSVGALVAEQTIQDLPLNGRSFTELAQLQVGVTWGKRGGSNIIAGQRPKISISGARPSQNSVLLDGTDISDYRGTMPGGISGLSLGVEAVREFQVKTHNFSAEHGRSSGGVIVVVTKSGTNEFHGSVFEFHRNDNLDARNFFDPGEPPEFKRNQFGASAGGPIIRNRTFFFASYEALRERLGETKRGTMPTLQARQGILPGRPDPVEVAPQVKPYLELFPLPNGQDFGDGRGEFIIATSQPTTEDYVSGRMDYKINDSHSFFGRYTFDDSEVTVPTEFPFAQRGNSARNQYVTLQETAILSPVLLNTFRAGFSRARDYEQTLVSGIPSILNWVPGVPLFTSGQLSVTGLSAPGARRSPRGFAYNNFEWSDDLNYIWREHSFKTGVILKRLRVNSTNLNAGGGDYSFGSLTDLLQARPNEFLVDDPRFSLERGLRQTLFGIYLQDDIRLSPKLTVNLGLRWEFMTSPNEHHGRFSNLEDVLDNAPRVGNPLFYTFKDNVAPRIGIAWDPQANGKTAIRAGFGLFHDQPFPINWTTGRGIRQPPFALLWSLTEEGGQRIPFPDGLAAVLGGSGRDTASNDLQPVRHTGTGYALHYNFTIERQLAPSTTLSLGYSGSQSRKLLARHQLNTKFPVILPDGRKFFPADRPLRNPRYSNARFLTNDANSNYNGLLVSLRKAYSQGFQIQGSYTFSKVMSDTDTVVGNDFALGANQVMDAYDIRRDRGPAEFDTKHNFVVNSTYDLPAGSNWQGLAEKLLGGWQLGGILRIASGSPFSPLTAFGSFSGPSASERPDLVPGRSNNPVAGVTTGCPGFQAGEALGGPNRYFDPCAFSTPVRGFYGNLGRDTITDPGVVNLDLSLVKNTPVRRIQENFNIQFRAELFNLLNRANFATPSFNVFDRRGAPIRSAGRITRTVTDPRQIQFGLKAIW